jgi:pimeloyl-ACP methyl ester carboxylesterase
MSTLTDDGLAVPLDVTGSGPTALVLHGGGGPATVASIAAHLAERGHRAVVPTHPGWEGTPRPEWLATVSDLARTYLEWLRQNDARDVVVVGSSVGGWVAAELVVQDGGERVGRFVLVDAAGIEVPGEPMADFFALDPRGLAEHAWHDPAKGLVDPAGLAPERRELLAGNVATLRALAGDPYMHDPTLAGRLSGVHVPGLAIWGDADRIFPPGYGRAYAARFPDCAFVLVPDAGHLPHLENPAATFAALDAFLG